MSNMPERIQEALSYADQELRNKQIALGGSVELREDFTEHIPESLYGLAERIAPIAYDAAADYLTEDRILKDHLLRHPVDVIVHPSLYSNIPAGIVKEGDPGHSGLYLPADDGLFDVRADTKGKGIVMQIVKYTSMSPAEAVVYRGQRSGLVDEEADIANNTLLIMRTTAMYGGTEGSSYINTYVGDPDPQPNILFNSSESLIASHNGIFNDAGMVLTALKSLYGSPGK